VFSRALPGEFLTGLPAMIRRYSNFNYPYRTRRDAALIQIRRLITRGRVGAASGVTLELIWISAVDADAQKPLDTVPSQRWLSEIILGYASLPPFFRGV
jgi:hypothetical protein